MPNILKPVEWTLGRFSVDMGIDLGTANTLVSVRGRGIILNEPSVVAVKKETNEVLLDGMAVGNTAKAMLGKTPGGIQAIRPLKHGVIADFDVTEKMLRYFITKVHEGRSWMKPQVVIAVPVGITAVERRAVIHSAERAGARRVFLVDEPMAAGLGCDMPVTEAQGSLIVDIGGGTTEIAVLALGGPVASTSLRYAGDEMDDAIMNHLRRQHSLLIGEQTAERIKLTVGSAWPMDQELSMEVKGRDSVTGLPRRTTVTSIEIREALQGTVRTICEGVRSILEESPPEIAADLVEGGAVQTRLNAALDELRRAQQLASVGEYANARQLLRKGALEQVRGDLVKVGAYLRVQRPTFAEFEALAVTGGLDAFDGSMRAMEVGAKQVTATDVNTNARAAVSALEEVVYLLGRDRTYQAQKEKLAGGPVVRTDGAVAGERRDYLAEEEMIVRDAEKVFTEAWMTDDK